ncbi:tRNA uridine-5-carboxymethylaminomethyl(34) synthesis GTPase MnmE [Novispirillum itersonii]|uniref:tRNA uridine-5-carboxymethylaminomethyl(34) synthesis GTPase MnmE n=1 Tax=Novispirillum itersonii TaxID=189 RepID=UPI00036A079F|nr:tRNA uridine-5-carboxymethylaminomethyl(34) synthesis GTPase MnmE [Novispirillum itersonii]
MSRPETIFALATAPGRAGVAVIRISGPQAGAALQALCGKLPKPRQAARVRFCDPLGGQPLDDGLALWFPAPGSFTGEDVAELQGHGGKAVIDSLLSALCTLPGLRPAEPGEFTRRAFENGKLDLTQAEGLADLINAETEAQHRQALRQMDGALARLFDGWRSDLIRHLAHLEAFIDFPDEPIPDHLDQAVRAGISALAGAMSAHLADGHRGERIRDGLYIAVVGAPNAGKSSLVNALARREAAIVSAAAGTTRDVIEVHLDLGGYPVILADTAGLREAAEEVEAEGIRRALQRAENADLRLAVFDAGLAPGWDQTTLALIDDRTEVILNKTETTSLPEDLRIAGRRPHRISAAGGQGMAGLLAALTDRVRSLLETQGAPALTRQRHRVALEECVESLQRSLTAPDLELMAEDLRLAARALGRITGRVEVDDLLDVIFRDFCIGK